jgi:uncharacterized protein YrrD
MINARDAIGRPVLSRASAEELGEVRHFVTDAAERRIADVVVRNGRSDALVPWAAITGFGPDAVLVEDASSLRAPESDADKADVAGRRDPLGKVLLNDQGNSAGDVTDLEFDESSGALHSVRVKDLTVEASRVRGVGSYAVVVHASDEARALLG